MQTMCIPREATHISRQAMYWSNALISLQVDTSTGIDVEGAGPWGYVTSWKTWSGCLLQPPDTTSPNIALVIITLGSFDLLINLFLRKFAPLTN